MQILFYFQLENFPQLIYFFKFLIMRILENQDGGKDKIILRTGNILFLWNQITQCCMLLFKFRGQLIWMEL